MTRDEALMHLTVAYGHHPAVADFNIVAVNHVLDSLIQAEREACAKVCEDLCTVNGYERDLALVSVAAAIRARSGEKK